MGIALAAGLDWLEALLPLLFVVFWIVSQIVAVIRKVAEAGRTAGPPPLPPSRTAPDGTPSSTSLETEIREFLARSAESRKPNGSIPKGPPPLPGADKGAVRGAPATTAAGSGSQSLSGTLGKRERLRDNKPQQVGSDVAAHVRDVFGREMRHLSSPLAGEMHDEPLPSRSSRADRLLKLLRSPSGLKDLVVIREILDRPPTSRDPRDSLF